MIVKEGSSVATKHVQPAPPVESPRPVEGPRAQELSAPTSELSDPETVAAEHRVEAAQERFEQALETLPPDQDELNLSVTLPEGTSPSEAAEPLADAWSERLAELGEPGDPAAMNAYLDRNRDTLVSLGRILMNGQDADRDEEPEEYQDQFYAEAVQMLAADNPEASFSLLAIDRDGNSLPERFTPMVAPHDTQIVIEMTQPDGTTEHYMVNPTATAGQDFGANLNGLWDQFAEEGQVPPEVDQLMVELQAQVPQLAGGEDAIGRFDQVSQLANLAGSFPDAFLELTPESQQIYTQIASGGYPGGRPYGTFLTPVDHLQPDDVMVVAKADHLVTGEVPERIESHVSVAGVPELDKLERFQHQHFEELTDIYFATYEQRGDQAVPLEGSDLLNHVGAAMHMPPDNPALLEPATADEALAQGEFYSSQTLEQLAPVTEQIEAIAAMTGGPAAVATIPVVYENEETGIVQLPLFRVEGQDGREFFVDNQGRRYTSFEDWQQNNQLPPGQMRYPEGGHLGGELATDPTPAVVDTPEEVVTQVLDRAALVGGLVVGAAAVIGTGGAAIPIVGAGLAAYQTVRSAQHLHDMNVHGQDIGLDNPAARMEWLSIGANAFTLGALGAQGALGAMVRAGAGANATSAMIRFTAFATAGAQWADTAAMVDMAAYAAGNWEDLSGLEKAQMLSQAVFWTGMQVHSARQAGVSLQGLYDPRLIESGLLSRLVAPPSRLELGELELGATIGGNMTSGNTGVVRLPDGTEIPVVVLRPSSARVQNELAAPVLNAELGFSNGYPETVIRPGVDGIVQEYAGENLHLAMLGRLGDQAASPDGLVRLLDADPELAFRLEEAFVERLIYGDGDDHALNFVMSEDGVVRNIDLDYAFPAGHPEPQWLQAPNQGINTGLHAYYSDRPLSPQTVENLSTFVGNYATPEARLQLAQQTGLSPEQIDGVVARAEWFVESGQFPTAYTLQEILARGGF